MIADILLTAVIPVFFIAVVKYGSRKDSENLFFMSKSYGNFMKGLCAIIVVLFHIPSVYQNPIQHSIGSFAFVAVTLFFLFSSYGMQLNVEHNSSYLQLFWKKRLLSLLIPVFIVNIFYLLIQLVIGKNTKIEILFCVDNYVVVLLQYCLLFYVVNYLHNIKILHYYWQIDMILIIGVILSSLYILYSLPSNAPSGENYWYVERYGLIWGLLLYRYSSSITQWLVNMRSKKILFAIIVSVLMLTAFHSLKHYSIAYRYFFEILSAFLLIVLLFLLTQRWQSCNYISMLLGSISYEIYLSHRYMMNLILDIYPSIGSGSFIISVFVFTFIFSYSTHFLCVRLFRKLRLHQ